MDDADLKKWCENNLYRDDGWFDGNKSSEKWYIKNNSIEIYNALINFKEKNNLTKISEVAYWLKHDINTTPICLVCHAQLRFYGKTGYSNVCGKGSCRAAYHEITMLEKYGISNYAKSESFKNLMISKRKNIEEKKKETCIQRYGVDNPMKAREIKNKLEETMILRFGCKTNLMCLDACSIERRLQIFSSGEYRTKHATRQHNYSEQKKKNIIKKRCETLVKTFGSLENAYKEKHERSKKTIIEKYGVENPQQHPEIHEKTQKSRYKFKDFKMPSGKIVQVQGYEGRALSYIFSNRLYSEDQIEVRRKEMPEIWYSSKKRKHRYFSDIFVHCENKMIEVKSDYTMNSNLELNYKKRNACIAAGYNFEFWIFSKDADTPMII